MNSSLRQFVNNWSSGPRRTLRWGSNTVSRYNSGKTFWIVETKLRKETFIRLLRTKYLWGLAKPIEVQALLDEPSSLRNTIFTDSLLAKQINKVPLVKLWPRIGYLHSLGKVSFMSTKAFECIVNFPYRITEYDIPIRPPKKYSGYVRNPSAVGAKRRIQRQPEIPEKVVEEYVQECSFLEFLTVGDLLGTTQFSIQRPDDWVQLDPKRFVKH